MRGDDQEWNTSIGDRVMYTEKEQIVKFRKKWWHRSVRGPRDHPPLSFSGGVMQTAINVLQQ